MPNKNQSSCVPCEIYEWSGPQDERCYPCGPGRVPNGNQSFCNDCGPDQYAGSEEAICRPCGEDTNPVANQSTCVSVINGQKSKKSSNAVSGIQGGIAAGSVLGAMLTLILLLVLYRRYQNANIWATHEDIKSVYAARFGVKVGGVSEEADSKGISFRRNTGNLEPSLDRQEGMELGYHNPLAPAMKESVKLSTDDRRTSLQRAHASVVHVASDNTYSLNANSIPPGSERSQVLFVEPRSKSSKVAAGQVRVVSAAAPKLAYAAKQKQTNPQIRVAAAEHVDTSEMRRTERVRLRLRVWKANLFLEPPPLVQVEIPVERNAGSYEYGYNLKNSDEQSADSKAQELAKRMQFTKRANISNHEQFQGLDLRRERRGPRVSKKEFGQSLPLDRSVRSIHARRLVEKNRRGQQS
eukprot:gb/GECG01010126.1/.p1 GENE.gb/GECG01010126.1/~~gb/GECG01010126.1/.p1  ORF type:complete len:410 (+),score=49.64 gb/GECG01010126.1/:1-1230(+)